MTEFIMFICLEKDGNVKKLTERSLEFYTRFDIVVISIPNNCSADLEPISFSSFLKIYAKFQFKH